MPFDEMDFKFATRVSKVVSKHVVRGTPLDQAWRDIVKAASPMIGPAVTKAALALPITSGLVTITSEFASLLLRDNPGPAKKVNGLWFGLAEICMDEECYDTIWMPYICGSTRFPAKARSKNPDWPCNPAWFPDDRWASNAPMTELSALCSKHKKHHWYIETCLIEPLHQLYIAHFARGCPPAILLGKAKSRGIGCGFDDGDLLTIGVSDAKGFKPAKSS